MWTAEELDRRRDEYVRRRNRRLYRDILLGTLAVIVWALVSYKLIELI